MQNLRVKLSVVSYLNSKPFIKALENELICNDIDLSLDIPSECAAKLSDGRADIGLVPVAIIPSLSEAQIVSDYCIAADGLVGSVLLLSHVPLEKIKDIYLDYQSRTSVQLVKILSKKLWKIAPNWIQGSPGYENLIQGESAGLVIGDRALVAKANFPYCYDLADEWKKLTGLPFVFACWVANKNISAEFISRLNKALAAWEENIPEVIADYDNSNLSKASIEKYLRENIKYVLDERKREGMKLFMKYLQD